MYSKLSLVPRLSPLQAMESWVGSENEASNDQTKGRKGLGMKLLPPSLSLTRTDMMKQSLSLARKPHVVIATPGRLADHLRSTDTVSLKKIKFLVR